MDSELLKGHWNNWAWIIVVYLDELSTFVPDIVLDMEKMRSTRVWKSYCSLTMGFRSAKSEQAKEPYNHCKKTVLELLKRHWGVSIEVYSVIWTNPFDHLSSYANREWINVVSTRSTGFKPNKRYAISLEFLGDLCLKVGSCLSVIPFSSAINVISTRNAALV